MSWTIADAIKSKSISSAVRLHSEYAFQIGDLSDTIRIKIWRQLTGKEGFYFTQSHFIQTPSQRTPHRTNSIYDVEDTAHLLHLALQTIVPHYEEAVAKGHVPEPSWLVPNEDF